jgi:hypothetical protein
MRIDSTNCDIALCSITTRSAPKITDRWDLPHAHDTHNDLLHPAINELCRSQKFQLECVAALLFQSFEYDQKGETMPWYLRIESRNGE